MLVRKLLSFAVFLLLISSSLVAHVVARPPVTPRRRKPPLKKGANAHLPIVFVHLHKAMGTTICGLAKRHEQMTAYQRGHNCNLLDDSPKTPEFSNGYSCAQRAQVVEKASEPISFMAIERFMDPVVCPDQFLYLIVVRKPLDRIVSHANYDHHKTGIMPLMHTYPPHMTAGKKAHPHWNKFSKTTFNNFYVRVLNGKKTFVSEDPITQAHLQIAQDKLSKFQYVIIQERFNEAGPLLASLGWNVHGNMLAARKNTRKHGTFEDMFTVEEQTLLIELNSLDETLYTFAGTLFDAQLLL